MNYLDQLKSLASDKIKVRKEVKQEILNELFIETSEIESLPKGPSRDAQIIRLSIIAELDASNLYEKLANLAQNKKLKEVLLDVSREEKVHFGEFEAMLEKIDKEFEKAEEEGEDEVEEE